MSQNLNRYAQSALTQSVTLNKTSKLINSYSSSRPGPIPTGLLRGRPECAFTRSISDSVTSLSLIFCHSSSCTYLILRAKTGGQKQILGRVSAETAPSNPPQKGLLTDKPLSFSLSVLFSLNNYLCKCIREFLSICYDRLALFFVSLKRMRFSWTLFLTWSYFLFFLVIPILALIKKASQSLFKDFFLIATQPIALSAYTVTFSMAFVASIFNGIFGFILAWVLVRYNFPGKRLLDAAIDLPFAVPTSVAGLTLATVYSRQTWIGEFLSNFGIQIVYTRLGIAIAMVFVSLPFVVRAVQPVLQEMDQEIEEAAWALGASPWRTFRKVVLPPLLPAFITGLTLGFSRAIGEYGSLVLVSSNIPLKDLIASVLIFQNLEQYEYAEATVIATVVLLISFFILLAVNSLQSWNRNKRK